jgi:serine protease Do
VGSATAFRFRRNYDLQDLAFWIWLGLLGSSYLPNRPGADLANWPKPSALRFADIVPGGGDMSEAGFGEIAEQLRRVTVLIRSGGRGVGSGVIWSRHGLIVTNAHVARGSQTNVELWDGRAFAATIRSLDPRRDLAQLCIEACDLPAAAPADSSQLSAGQTAIAVGNPLGFVGALTTGVIHAVGAIPQLGSQVWVQARLRLAPGNSGGPLADARGRIVGINTLVAGGLALAIPSNSVSDFLSAGPVSAWLGITVHPVTIPQVAKGSRFGLLVLEIDAGSPAECASLLPGDILLGAEGRSFTALEDLARALEGRGPRLLRLEFLRGDYARIGRVAVQLGTAAATGTAAAA